MPTYEYCCQECGKRFEVSLSYERYESANVTCPNCGSNNIQRLISRVRIAKSEETRIENMVDPSHLNGIEDNPKALGRLMRRMGNEMGEDMGSEFDEVVSRLEKGQNPDQIEKDLPEI